ncbi:hypothetical protein BDR26DRAFT_207630 [Obelidium mucronatum]|nr:hypothetical protein BDR26DRAFT_207630 [Obelidium mucronatum]
MLILILNTKYCLWGLAASFYIYKRQNLLYFLNISIMTTPTQAGSGAIHMGRHCEAAGCNRLDFLPFRCHLCQGTYCDTHTKFSFHVNCSGIQNNTVIECPVCLKPVGGTSSTLQSMTEINNIISQHIDSGCVDIAAIESKQRRREKQCNGFAKPGVRCTEPGLMQCKQCQLQYCAKHRFYEDHGCGKQKSQPGSAAQSRAASGQASPVLAKPGAVTCPVCRANVSGADASMSAAQINQLVGRHIDGGCATAAPKKSGLFGWLSKTK